MAQFRLAKTQQIRSLEEDRAIRIHSFAIEQSEDRHRQRAFAGTALADQPNYFAVLDFELHVPQDRGFTGLLHGYMRGKENVELRFLSQDVIADEKSSRYSTLTSPRGVPHSN